MVIKRWSSAFFLMVVLPAVIIWLAPTAFFVLMSLLTLTVTCSSLKKLIILNFASDLYIEQNGLPLSHVPSTRKEAALRRAMLLGLHVLLLVFFAYTFWMSDLAWLKVSTAIVALCWAVDMLRTQVNAARGGIAGGDWTWRDTLAEGFIWFQNIASIALVAAAFAVKFFL